jgi:hypothetical protein
LLDDNRNLFVTDDHPNAERQYRAQFFFDPNSMRMTSGNTHDIFYGYAGTSTLVLRVQFQYFSDSYQLRAGLRNDGSTWTNTLWSTITDTPHRIELDWRASAGVGANTGGLTLWIDSVQKGDITRLDNDTRRIDRVRLGAVAGIDTGTRGLYYFDAFESRRVPYIGP